MPPFSQTSGPRDERDQYLFVNSVVTAATELLHAYQDWVVGELMDLISRAELSKAEGHPGAMEKLGQVLLRLKDIQNNEFPTCLDDLRAIIRAVNARGYNDVVEARRTVEMRCSRFDNMVLELLGYRHFFDALEQGSPPEEVPEP